MRATLEPLYTASFTTPESWSVRLSGEAGGEGQSFLIAEGHTEGRLSGRLRAANYPRARVDGVLLPDFRGVLSLDDGATILFSWHGITRPPERGVGRRLLGAITHVTDDPRYEWLNSSFGVLTGEVRPCEGGGFEVVLEIADLVADREGRGSR